MDFTLPGQLPIAQFARLPTATVAALLRDFPSGAVTVNEETIARLIHTHKARPGAVARALTLNAPRGVARLWALARVEILGLPMPDDLGDAVRRLAGDVLNLMASGRDHWMDAVTASFNEVIVRSGAMVSDESNTDGEATLEAHRWHWAALAFADIAMAMAILARTRRATHDELELLVDHYCDCMGDYRQFVDEFPYDDGPNAHTVCVVVGLTSLEVADDRTIER